MFHIVINSDEKYIKYTAVLLYSIVKSSVNFTTQEVDREVGKNREKYIFHILTDFISPKTQQKLQKFQKQLNILYPCEISLHYVNQSVFEGLNKWGFEKKQNYLTYYRLLLKHFLPKDLKICLYLDVDMLVVRDLRELFTIDLGDNFAGVVLDSIFIKRHIIPSKNAQYQDIILNPNWQFNGGFLLINLQLWRSENIEQKALNFLQNYNPRFLDQDTLNVLFGDKTFKLGLEWNFVIFSTSNNAVFKGENEKYTVRYTRDEHNLALKNLKIIHYNTSLKPWKILIQDKKCMQNLHNQRIYKWWEYALKTPIFNTDIKMLKYQLILINFLKSIKHKMLSKLKKK